MSDSTAIVNADGEVQVVKATHVRVCVPTAKCMAFWAQFSVCVIAMVIGTVLMILFSSATAQFTVGATLLSLGVGNMLPSPQYTSILPKTSSTDTSGAQIP